MLKGILWVLGTGALWAELPNKYRLTKPSIVASGTLECSSESSGIGGRMLAEVRFIRGQKAGVVIWHQIKMAIVVDQLSRLISHACGLGTANQRNESRSRRCRARR